MAGRLLPRATAHLVADERQLLPEHGVLRELLHETIEERLCVLQLLLAQRGDDEQNAGEGAQVATVTRRQLQLLDPPTLVPLDAVVVREPSDEERQVANDVLERAKAEVGVVERRRTRQELLGVHEGRGRQLHACLLYTSPSPRD